MKRIVAAVAAAGLGLAALHAVPAGAAVNPPAGARATPIAWHPCPRPFPAGVDCGMVAVPLDHGDPAGRRIGVAVSRVRHTGPAAGYQGVLLVNPGGPGAAGRDFAVSVADRLPVRLRAAYDVIGFDPRGAGASRPALSCAPDYFKPVRPDYLPASAAEEQVWLNRSRGYAEACGRRYGALLDHLKTVDAARDLEDLRVALGHEKINYLGASYGTYLGAVYATLYPGRVRRMVLDSIVQPSRLWYGSNMDQDYAFDASVKSFFAWIARHDPVYHLGGDPAVVEKSYYALRGELKGRPAQGVLGPDELDDTIQIGAYLAPAWPVLARAWSSYAAKGDPAALIDRYRAWGVGKEPEFAVYNAVQCTDTAWTRNWPAWRAETARIHATAPFQAWSNTWYNAPCLYWPAKAGVPVRLAAGRGLPAMLMFQATLDAATPYAGGLEMHNIFKGSRLVIEDGGRTHGVLQRGNACLDDTFNDYLATGALPPDVSHCRRLPDPVPF